MSNYSEHYEVCDKLLELLGQLDNGYVNIGQFQNKD